MLEFDIGYLRKIRVWFEHNQLLMLSSNNKAQIRKYPCHINNNSNNKTVIIELFIPQGGRIVYGLLGAKYMPTLINELEVSIFCSNKISQNIFNDALIDKIEPAHISLSEEYCNAVFDSIDSISRQGKLKFNGKLEFCYGATAEISSNEWIFRKLTYLLINLFNVADYMVDVDLLKRLIDAEESTS